MMAVYFDWKARKEISGPLRPAAISAEDIAAAIGRKVPVEISSDGSLIVDAELTPDEKQAVLKRLSTAGDA